MLLSDFSFRFPLWFHSQIAILCNSEALDLGEGGGAGGLQKREENKSLSKRRRRRSKRDKWQVEEAFKSYSQLHSLCSLSILLNSFYRVPSRRIPSVRFSLRPTNRLLVIKVTGSPLWQTILRELLIEALFE